VVTQYPESYGRLGGSAALGDDNYIIFSAVKESEQGCMVVFAEGMACKEKRMLLRSEGVIQSLDESPGTKV
jgi:hypothetical protein